MQIKDQLQRKIILDHKPSRIVSLVPSQTELLVDLGLRNSLVGITKFCVHPNELRKEKMVVGGTKEVNLDKIKKLSPDFIICNKEENTKEMVLSLEKIAPVWVSDIQTIDDSVEMIQWLGSIFHKENKAAEIISEILDKKTSFEKFTKEINSKKVIYLIWKNPYMAAGKNTFIDSLLRLNKFENCIVSETSRYPEVSMQQIEEVDLVLLSSEPYPFKAIEAEILKNIIGKEVKLVDGEYFSWYGSRLKNAFTYFRTLH